MAENFISRLFEHNNWSNSKIIEACYALSDEQLDTKPRSVTKGNIRETLVHLVKSQRGYLALLTLPPMERPTEPVKFEELLESAHASGKGLLALASGEKQPLSNPLETTDGFKVEPWVVMVQAINHATEHREQIKSMISDLGITPPDIDGWDYGEAAQAMVPISK
jgi:uncharacterized damage-inducible protein DinB